MSNIKRILIQTGKATSLNVVAQHIAKVALKEGMNYILQRYIPPIYDFKRYYDGVILIYPFSQTYSVQWFLAYREAKIQLNSRVAFYTLCDGVPKTSTLPEFVRRDCEFITNSYYSKSKLEQIGVKVLEVVHHGYDPEEIELSRLKVNEIDSIIREKFGNVIRFLYVGDYNIRKGVKELIYAVKKLYEKYKNFVLFLVTKREVIKLIENIPNIYLVAEFGSRAHYEIYSLYQVVDFVVLPSRCESFGLPLLEANACSTPVIATKLPVFLEYASYEGNIFVEPSEITYADTFDGVLYEIHLVSPTDLASAMEYAIDIRLNYPSLYEDMRSKVYEKVKDMTIYSLYKEILKYVK